MEVYIFTTKQKFTKQKQFFLKLMMIKIFYIIKKKVQNLIAIQKFQIFIKKNIFNMYTHIYIYNHTHWNIAKWKGDRFWYEHSKVRVLLFQYNLKS